MTTEPNPTITLRDLLRDITPPWLQRYYADALLWAVVLQLDSLYDATIAGVKTRFPGLYTYESLEPIGRERRIRRGRVESSAGYALRLRRWLTDHATRGNAYSMLAQLHAHYAPDNFVIHLVYKSGRRFTMAADGTVTTDLVPPPMSQVRWARWTLFYFTNEWPTPDTVTQDDKNDLVMIPKEWLAAHAIGQLILMPTGVELWNYHVPPRQWNNPYPWNKVAGTRLEI